MLAEKIKIERQNKLRRAVETDRRKVDYLSYKNDFLVVMLARVGIQSNAISKMTGLSLSQVNYRINKAEREYKHLANEDGRKYFSQRKQYRTGDSEVAHLLMNQLASRNSLIRKNIVNDLEKQGLYSPKAKGVLRSH